MMKYAPLLLIALAGCPDDPKGNPGTLWLAPNMAETAVRLVDSEPGPY